MNFKSKCSGDDKEVGIAFSLSSRANKTLTISAKKAERAKKREGKLRLEDHLKRFPNWSL